MPKPREIEALCTDYDRTLTDIELRPVPEAWEALRRARRAGRKIVIVSGRPLGFLLDETSEVADAIVAENGAFLHRAGATRRLGAELDLSRVEAIGVVLERGLAIASADIRDEPKLRELLREPGVRFVRNRDRVMVLPHGVDKAAGALAALELLGIAPERAAAVGDGENDATMLAAVGHAIAVANAVPELRAIADVVTAEEGGHGVAAWIERVWLPSLEARA